MIVAVAVLAGFQEVIRLKVTGFSSHIRIDKFDANSSYESSPVNINQPFYPSLSDEPGIRHIQAFTLKAGLVKTGDRMLGVVLKGIGKDFDGDFIRQALIEGRTLQIPDSGVSNEVIISSYQAAKLDIGIGDDLRVYFISPGQDQPRGRKFTITGIYETGLEEVDKVFLLGDMRHIQKLNLWKNDEVSGFEVFIDDFRKLDEMAMMVYQRTGYDLNIETIRQAYPQIFDWLKLMDMNVVIILVMMILVSSITMISTLLIIILDRTNMVGVLKALGMKRGRIRRIFLYHASGIILRGLVWGNLAGVGVCLLQYYFSLIPLDPASYYMETVPIRLNIYWILLTNAGTFMLSMLALLLPSIVVDRITPVRAMRVN